MFYSICLSVRPSVCSHLFAVAQIKSAPSVKLLKVVDDEMLAMSFKPVQPADDLQDVDKYVHSSYQSVEAIYLLPYVANESEAHNGRD